MTYQHKRTGDRITQAAYDRLSESDKMNYRSMYDISNNDDVMLEDAPTGKETIDCEDMD